MGTLFDYLNWRGDLTFSQSPMNEVDGMIFSLLTYLDMKGIVPDSHGDVSVPIKAAVNAFAAKYPNYKKMSLGVIVPKEILKLFRAVKTTRRFANVEMCAHVNIIDTQKEMQFSATTFLPDDGTVLVAFRGTDDTIIGWKENFNMSFLPVVPAQVAATEYLERAAGHLKGEIRLTGHSKGGNLAVYATTHCQPKTQKRILRAWSFDGPGFGTEILSDPDYIEMRPVIRSLVPQSSVVGMLLEHDENYTVVKSRQAGLFQHDGFSWNVMGNSFVHLQTVTGECKRIDRTLNEWIKNMTPEQREQFTDALYQMISVNNAATLTDLVKLSKSKLLKRGDTLDPHVRKTVVKTLSVLLEMNTKNMLHDILPKRR